VTAVVAPPVPEGMAAAQARVASLRSLLGLRSSTAPTFAAALSAATTARPAASTAVELAKEQIGTPYVWGAEDPATGFDCSGLVQYVYGRLGVELPRTSAEQARAGEPVASLADARPGDLVAFGSPVDHIGIYAGGNTMVVAPHAGASVRVQEISQTPTAIRRVGTRPATSFDELFASAGARHGVDPSLLASVARAESGLDPRAVSRAGARGLMQLMPGTAASLGVDPFDPSQAVDGAARLLKSHLEAFGSTELALAAYNAGPGAVRRYGGVPPYAETQAYVRRVLGAM
jgi:hypothetical protein